MRLRILKIVTLLAFTAFSSLALADDPPARVGRISFAEGRVEIGAEPGDEASGPLLNWPVTSHNKISTGRDSRAEFRVGASAVRLDADTSLEIVELDDDNLRLHLHYGSVSVRIRNPEALAGFALSTPEGRLRMREPGRLRVDAERVQDTSVINVFEGVALVEGGAAPLTVRAGRRVEIHDDEVRTALAVRDGFDDWAQQRDQRDERSASAQYVTSDMTGYEELDRNGSWRENAEYGPLWLPNNVGLDWAPYRDGRWAWIAPWGWTWVDNAPWGYAPFHYGRWVYLNQRWAWAPGRNAGRPVWAPALVGWVGGAGGNLNFGAHGNHRQAPGQGWYPLGPREPFVPGYRLSAERLQHLNRHARNERGHDRDDRHDRHDRHEGLTVLPHNQAPQVARRERDWRVDGRGQERDWRVDGRGHERGDRRDQQPAVPGMPPPAAFGSAGTQRPRERPAVPGMPPPAAFGSAGPPPPVPFVPAPQPVTPLPAPGGFAPPAGQRFGRGEHELHRREPDGVPRLHAAPIPVQRPAAAPPPPQAAPAPPPQAAPAPAVAPQAAAVPRLHAAPIPVQRPAAAPPAPPPQALPPPPPQAAPAPAVAPQAAAAPRHHGQPEQRRRNEAER